MKVLMNFFIPVRNNLTALLLFLAGWWALSIAFRDTVVPSPVHILQNISVLADRGFLFNLKLTVLRTGLSFLIAFACGTLVGMFAFTLKIHESVETFLALLQVLPGTLLGIIFLLIFGVGNTVPIVLAVSLVSPLMAIHTSNCLLKKNNLLIDMVRSFRGTIRNVIQDIYIPALIPAMKSNTTTGMVFSLKIVILGEFLAAENGLGYLLNASRIYFNMQAVYFYLLAMVVLIVCFQIVAHTAFVVFFGKYLYPDA